MTAARNASEGLVGRARQATTERQWLSFSKAYRREMSRPEASRLLELLAARSRTRALSVGCYCEDESRRYRS